MFKNKNIGKITKVLSEYLILCKVKEVDMGLAADVGTLQRLPRAIGSQSLVNELCLTARKLKAPEAEKCGLVSRVSFNKETILNPIRGGFLKTMPCQLKLKTRVCGITGSASARRWGGYGFNSRPKPRQS